MSLSHPLLEVNAEKRLSATIDSIITNEQVWILKDEDGCVMLTSDEEDGVPVWPDKALATLWATDEWDHCEPLSISLQDWMQKWTPGLLQDGLVVMVCPVPAEEGEVIEPDVLAEKILASKG